MLLLANLPAEAPLPAGSAFPDHADSRLLYPLPAGLVATDEPDGTPRFSLTRYRTGPGGPAGGLLYTELRLAGTPTSVTDTAAAAGYRLSPLPFHAARARLEHWAATLAERQPVGAWRDAGSTADVAIAVEETLTPDAVHLLETILASTDGGVDLAVQALATGLNAGVPMLAAADRSRLHGFLAAILGEQPANAAQVEAAFLSLPSGDSFVELTPLDETPTPPRETVLRRLAAAALADLFERHESVDAPWEADSYSLPAPAADAPPRLLWDLSPPVPAPFVWEGSWSITDLLRSLPAATRDKLFPPPPSVAPFAPVDVVVLCPTPVDPRHLTSIAVNVRSTGPAGVPEHRTFTFTGTSTVASFRAFYPAITDQFDLSARVTVTLPPPAGTAGWPRQVSGAVANVTGTVVQASAADAGVDVVALRADPEVFAQAAGIEVTLSRDGADETAAATLDGTAREAWIAVAPGARTGGLTAVVVAVERAEADATPRRRSILTGPVTGGAVHVGASLVDVLAPDVVTFSLDPAAVSHVAYAAVTAADPTGRSRTFTLDPGEAVPWSCWRRSIFDDLGYRYQIQYVSRTDDGHTLPLATSPWMDATDRALVVTPPAPAPPAPAPPAAAPVPTSPPA